MASLDQDGQRRRAMTRDRRVQGPHVRADVVGTLLGWENPRPSRITAMPKVDVPGQGPYRFFFFSNENDEPPHVHVRYDRSVAKFWLDPVELAKDTRFAAHRLTAVESLVRENSNLLLEAWRAHLGD